MKKVKLFCFPYAGGASTIYAKWKAIINKNIELHAVELPGRGMRFRESLKESIIELVDDIYNEDEHEFEKPFAFFGHSMASIIAYELSYKIFTEKGFVPLHVFFSGKKALHLSSKTENIHELPKEEFKKRIAGLGGTPPEVYENIELFDLFEPILRADFKAVETYKHLKGGYDLGCDITIFSGKEDVEDDIVINQLTEWSKYTSRKCRIHLFEGGHFFINDNYNDIINIINYTILNSINDKTDKKAVS